MEFLFFSSIIKIINLMHILFYTVPAWKQLKVKSLLPYSSGMSALQVIGSILCMNAAQVAYPKATLGRSRYRISITTPPLYSLTKVNRTIKMFLCVQRKPTSKQRIICSLIN
jgi:hypothetical protein